MLPAARLDGGNPDFMNQTVGATTFMNARRAGGTSGGG